MNLEKLNDAYEELKGEHEIIVEARNVLVTRYAKLDIAHTELNSSYKELESSLKEKAFSNTPSSHDGTTCVVKVNASTSCHDLLTIPCTSSYIICLLLRLIF